MGDSKGIIVINFKKKNGFITRSLSAIEIQCQREAHTITLKLTQIIYFINVHKIIVCIKGLSEVVV